METRHIRFLHEIAERGSVSAAARRLGLTQSALTKILARVEDELGARMFDRTARGVQANEFGRVFLDRARRIRMEMEDLSSEMRTMTSGLSGRVALGSGQVWISGMLPAAIGRANASYPRIEVHVRTGQFEELMTSLWRGELDFLLAQVRPGFNDDEVEIEPIRDTILHVTARKDHPLAPPGRFALHDATNYQWILPPVGDPGRDHLVDLLTTQGVPGPRVAVETTSYQLAARIMLETDMLCLLPDLSRTLYADKLKALRADWYNHRRSAGIVTLRTREQTTAVNNFLEIIRDEARSAI